MGVLKPYYIALEGKQYPLKFKTFEYAFEYYLKDTFELAPANFGSFRRLLMRHSEFSYRDNKNLQKLKFTIKIKLKDGINDRTS